MKLCQSTISLLSYSDVIVTGYLISIFIMHLVVVVLLNIYQYTIQLDCRCNHAAMSHQKKK